MDGKAFRERGEALYGHGWQTTLARRLGKGRSTIYRYGERTGEVPRWVALALDGLQAERIREIEGSSNVAAADPTSGGDVAGGVPSPSTSPAAEGL